jgi:hypothetical protein
MVTDYLMARMLERGGNETPFKESLDLTFEPEGDRFGLTRALPG